MPTVIDDKITISARKKNLAPDNVKCPECKGGMLVLSGRYGEFYGCLSYPSCRGSSKMLYGKKCTECGNELFKTIFTKPPYRGNVLCCLGYPKCKHVEKLEEKNFEEKHKEMMDRFRKNTRKSSTLA